MPLSSFHRTPVPGSLVVAGLVAALCLSSVHQVPGPEPTGPRPATVAHVVDPEQDPQPPSDDRVPSSQRAQSGIAGVTELPPNRRPRTSTDERRPPQRVPGVETWSGDLETGDLSQFHDAPWNTVVAEAPTIETDVVRSGSHAVRMTIPAGASTGNFGARSELVPGVENFQPGDDFYFGLSIYLDQGFPVQPNWQVVAQWKSEQDGSPPLELDVENGEFLLCGGESHPEGSRAFCESLGPADTGRWIDWVFRVTLSPDPDVGTVAVWRDGKEVLAPMKPPGGTMYPGAGSYMKVGYYRKSGIGPAGTVYFDNLTIRRPDR